MLQGDLDQIIEHLGKEFAKFRGGRATTSLVEEILVEAYNSKMPLKQLATLSIPEPRLIIIQPWDRTVIKNIETALRDALTDVHPVVDGAVIRIAFPSPTEERRKELTKQVGKVAEEARIQMRRVREGELQNLKQQEENKIISEDELFKKKEEVQKIVDMFSKKIEELEQKKRDEILTI